MFVLVYPQAMSFEARSLTVPSVMWLGLLPSDLQRFGLSICYFLLPPPASNWDYILGKFRLFVLVSVAVAIIFFPPSWSAIGKHIEFEVHIPLNKFKSVQFFLLVLHRSYR